jgi:hypothetical protein
VLNLRVMLLASLLAVGASGAALAADPGVGVPQPAAGHDERWPTNPTLRRQMVALRTLVQARSKSPLTATDYRVLGAEVKTRVEGIIATCELPSAADAAFHPILTELLAGAAMLAEPSEKAHVEGTRRIFAALDDYGRRFRHPGWKLLRI